MGFGAKEVSTMVRILPVLVLCSIPSTAGSIFVEDYEYQADLCVCVVEYEYQADLCVWVCDYSYQAEDSDAVWFYADYDYQADATICFVEHEYQADLNVCFVDYEYQAGWQSGSEWQERLH
jgi:hypothetical protein